MDSGGLVLVGVGMVVLFLGFFFSGETYPGATGYAAFGLIFVGTVQVVTGAMMMGDFGQKRGSYRSVN